VIKMFLSIEGWLFIAADLAVLIIYLYWLSKKEKPGTSGPSPMLSSSRSGPRCPSCGHVNPVGCQVCGNCGIPLGEEETRIY